jgi:hypothetical protein
VALAQNPKDLNCTKRPSVDTITRKRMRRKITYEIWEQIKTGYAAGLNLREIARKMNIPEGTVLAHAKRHGWTQQIQVATGQLTVMQSDAITPVQSVPQSVASILDERKDRAKLGLSKYAAEAAEEAAKHRDKLGIAGKVKDVASVHRTLWPDEPKTNEILPGWRILIGAENVIDAKTGYVCDGPDKGKFFPVDRDQEEEISKELPSPVIEKNEKVPGASSPAMDCDSPNATKPTISRAPASADARVSTEDDPARSAYRERCMHWRRYRSL